MIKELKITSDILKQERLLSVFTPDDVTGPFQVLYMYDGQNLFDKNKSSYGDIWDVATQVSRMIKAGLIPPLMVVGIHSTKERLDEYVPFDNRGIYSFMSDEFKVPYYGHLTNQFIVEELMPFINDKYHTLKSYNHIAGSSLGGLMALHAGLTYPKHFRGIGAFSIASHFNKDGLKTLLQESKTLPYQKYFLPVGTNESNGSDTLVDRAYIDIVETVYRSLSKHNKTLYKVFNGARHNETFWASLMPTFLYFIFQA